MKLSFLLISLMVQALLAGAQESGGVISGRITFTEGRAGADVLVVAVPAAIQTTPDRAARASALLDEAGNYRLEDVPPGRYFIRTRWTEPEMYYPGVIEMERAVPVEISARTSVRDLNFAITTPGFKVSGRVGGVAPQGRGRNSTAVRITGPHRFSANIGLDGRFEFPQVPPGDYAMVLSVPGAEEIPLRVIDRDVAGIELQPPTLTEVRGTVEYAAGERPPGFGLALTFSDGLRPIAVSTNAEDRFRIALPPGEYQVTLRGILTQRATGASVRSSEYLRSLMAGAVDLTASTFRISAGVQPPEIKAVVDVSAVVELRGRVTMDGADIPPDSTITMIDRMNGRRQQKAPILTDGSFRFTKLLPGNYAARVAIGAGLPAAPVPVVVPNHDVDDLIIPAGKLKQIQGSIVTEGRYPGPPISLTIFQGSRDLLNRADPFAPPILSRGAFDLLCEEAEAGRAQMVTLEIDPRRGDTFQFALPEGEYQVALNNETQPIPPAFSLSTLAYGAANLLTEPLRVSSSADAELLVGFRTPAPETWVKVSGRLTGRLTGEHRIRMEEAVTLETPVNADGTFMFADVPPSRIAYTVSVVPPVPGVAPLRIPVKRRDVDGVDFAIPTLKQVTGNVTFDGGSAAPGLLRLSLKNKSHTVEISVRPDAAGNFTVELPVGSRLAARRTPGVYKPFSPVERVATLNGISFLDTDSPAIREDGPDEIRLELTPDTSLPRTAVRGRVTGEDVRSDGLRIELTSVAQFQTFAATAAPDGSFSLDRIPLGTYQISLMGANDLIWSPLIANVAGPGSRIDITVRQGRNSDPSVSFVTKSAPVATTRDAGGGATGSEDESSAAVANLRTINTAEVTYLSVSGGNYGSLSQLIAAGLLTPDIAKGEFHGYSYAIVAEGGDYLVTAVPAPAQTDNHAFFSSPDGVVRYSAAESLAPPGQQGRPVQ
ncbi:MAG TPA: carboxypeptidase-like regulatory domain-containing protein [Terriglobia bacterium]|nr:carboxypeptidase-like regulatory domain-containing protein [Terriglobia bacterium]